MADEVYMDIPAVTNIANSFGTFGDALQKVSQGLQAAITVLQVTAFMGMVGAKRWQLSPNRSNRTLITWQKRCSPCNRIFRAPSQTIRTVTRAVQVVSVKISFNPEVIRV